jgi:signal peptidase I
VHELETLVLRSLGSGGPASGGRLAERLLAADAPLVRGRAVLIYAALANLERRGEVAVLVRDPAERIWGLPGESGRVPTARQGAPSTFSLGSAELGRLDDEMRRRTRGLPLHYFEEIRRAVVADADRRTTRGQPPREAVSDALREWGPASAVRAVLRRVEGGGRVPLRLPAPRRWVLVPLALLAVVVLVRIFLIGFYTLPPESISMAPTLIPGAEGGDSLVLVDLTSHRRSAPERGEIVVFRPVPSGKTEFVKRVMGLSGERITIRHGEVVVDGKPLVKERALLDRLAVPLEERGFEARDGGVAWSHPAPVQNAFRLPNGSWSPARGTCLDLVCRLRVRRGAMPGSVSIVWSEVGGGNCSVALNDHGHGAGVSVLGREIAAGAEFKLPEGRAVEVWATNADGVFRVEIDGREVARGGLNRRGREATVEIFLEGESVEILDADLARDLVYLPISGDPAKDWVLGPTEFFVLGDNSAESRDSRHLGPISAAALMGRAVAVAWPLSRARLLR